MCFIVKTYNFIKNLDENKKKNTVYQNSIYHRGQNHMLNSKHKKNRGQKSEDKNIQIMDNAVYSIATIGHSEYKDVFLNKKCLRNPM